MHLRKILLTFIAAMSFAIPALAWAASLQVQDAAVSTGVHDRVPTGISSYFDSSVGKLYAFTRITGAEGDTRTRTIQGGCGEGGDRPRPRSSPTAWR